MSQPPRIALVQDWLTTFRGGEQVLLALHTLLPEAPIYTSIYNPEKVPQFSRATVHTSYLQKIPTAKTRFQVLIPLMPQAFESFDLKSYDVVLSVGNGFSKGVITHPGQRHLWYCHTPARYLWKLGGDTRNEGRADSWLRSYAEHRLRIWDVVSSSRPDVIIANSQGTADRIAKIYRREANVIYPPVDTSRFNLSSDTPEDYFLTVGQLVAYKRVDLVISACLAAGKRLKVVGEGPERQALERVAQGSPLIEFLGRVSSDELGYLYAHTQAFIFAGEEDLGIVPIEAMSAGRPVIAFKRGGLTETVREGLSGIFFAEQTVESLVEAVKEFKVGDFEPEKVRAHATTFSLDVFNQQIAKVLASEGVEVSLPAN